MASTRRPTETAVAQCSATLYLDQPAIAACVGGDVTVTPDQLVTVASNYPTRPREFVHASSFAVDRTVLPSRQYRHVHRPHGCFGCCPSRPSRPACLAYSSSGRHCGHQRKRACVEQCAPDTRRCCILAETMLGAASVCGG